MSFHKNILKQITTGGAIVKNITAEESSDDLNIWKVTRVVVELTNSESVSRTFSDFHQ